MKLKHISQFKKVNDYKHIWVFSYFIIYVPWYFGLQTFRDAICYDVYTKIDALIPFISWFIYPYIYWYLFVAGTICFLFFTDKKEFYQSVTFLFVGMTICLIIYTIFPTSFNHRPEIITGSPLSVYLTQWIYSADQCENVLPSIHVFNSIACMIALLKSQHLKNYNWVKIFAIGSTILITLSTMFVRQHSILDAIAASCLSIILYIFIYKKDILSKYVDHL